MRHNSNSRRSRGRGNGRRNNSNRLQTYDSNGPDVRIRGTAYQINEKYVALARDAASAGDHTLAENYLQHAEHYQRIINEHVEKTEGSRDDRGARKQSKGGNDAQQQAPKDKKKSDADQPEVMA